MTVTQEPCGDTCSVVASMASTFKEFVPKEQRMAQAIAAVQSGKMSQRGAALKFDLDRRTIGRHLSKVGHLTHPETSQSTTQVSESRSNKLTSGQIRSALRTLCRQNNAPHGVAKNPRNGISSPEARGWLKWEGIEIPSELDGKTDPFTPLVSSATQSEHDTDQQGLPSDNSLPVVSGGEQKADPDFYDNPAFADNLDIDAVRQHVNEQVQQSDRPADFKRAIQLLTELDTICTNAWYKRQPEPWGHDDWAHVSSEIRALDSIVGQRAEETADELLRKNFAVEVNATAVY